MGWGNGSAANKKRKHGNGPRLNKTSRLLSLELNTINHIQTDIADEKINKYEMAGPIQANMAIYRNRNFELKVKL